MRQISGVNIYKEVTCMTNYREILRSIAWDSTRPRSRQAAAALGTLCSNPATGGELRPAMAAAGGNVG